jgi:hypothetical protein
MTYTMIGENQSRFSKLSLLAIAALAAVIAFAAVPQANAQAVTLLNRNLRNTDFQTQNLNIATGCGAVNCTAPPQQIFPALNVVCPVLKGKTCTFYIHLESQDTFLSPLDAGLFQFLVDAAPPVPGPTFGAGFFAFNNADPTSAVAGPQSHSYAVTARVKNAVDNQPHLIQVSVSCTDTDGSGACNVTTWLSNLEVNVYTP